MHIGRAGHGGGRQGGLEGLFTGAVTRAVRRQAGGGPPALCHLARAGDKQTHRAAAIPSGCATACLFQFMPHVDVAEYSKRPSDTEIGVGFQKEGELWEQRLQMQEVLATVQDTGRSLAAVFDHVGGLHTAVLVLKALIKRVT